MIPESVQKVVAKVREQWDPQYEPVVNHFTPWAPLTKPLRSSRLALISSAGLYIRDSQTPFDAGNPLGDPTFREIPGDTTLTNLAIAHDHYDHGLGEEDPNVVFPLDRLRTLVAAGEIGELAPIHYSFMGYCTRQLPLAADYGPEVAMRLRAAGVDAALVIAVWPLCCQSVGLVARAIELAGIPTFTLGAVPDMLALVKPPRAAWVKFPRGAVLGEPGNTEKHLAVLRECLRRWTDWREPGGLVELPFQWRR